MFKENSILFMWFLCASFAVTAQIGNQGELTIAPGTALSTIGVFDNAISGTVTNDGEFYLKGDLINNGGFTYTMANTTQGTLVLDNTAQQNLSGDGMIEVVRLNLNNTAGIANATTVSIIDEFNLVQGIFNNSDFGGTLWLEEDVSITGASNSNHVEGEIMLTEETTDLLPTGDTGQYQGMAIAVTDNGTYTFSATYNSGSSNAVFPHEQKQLTIQQIVPSGYWPVNQISGSGSAQLTLAYTTLVPAEWLATTERIRVVNYNDTLGIWQDMGGVINTANGTVTSQVPSTDYGIFTVALGIDETDTDGDGVPDYVEENGDPATDPDDPTDFVDSDGDGVPDYVEETSDSATDPNDPTDFTDDNGNGIPDYIEPNNDQGDLVVIHEVVSKNDPNGFFKILNITDFPENTFNVFNRYGQEVFKIDGYNDTGNVFTGHANKGALLTVGSDLADGVYFYVIKYLVDGEHRKQTGYLYVQQ